MLDRWWSLRFCSQKRGELEKENGRKEMFLKGKADMVAPLYTNPDTSR